MRIAIIDLGTNSVRFDIHQLGPKKKSTRLLHREKIMIRLGQGVFTKGQLDPAAIHRTTHAFSTFKKICDEFLVNRIIALGTSALREATDAPKLVAHIRKSTGIDVRVISGSEEAKLIAQGILGNMKMRAGKTALIDIGGGSTEVSIIHKKKILFCESFPLGTARLQQVFLKVSPPPPEAIGELRQFIRNTLFSKFSGVQIPKVSKSIGSSGTIKALARIEKKTTGAKTLKAKNVQTQVKKISRMNTTQLLELPGLEAKRVDMILAGTILLEECLAIFGIKEVLPTDYCLRDGILLEQIELAKRHMTSRIALHLPDLIEKARKLGGKEANLKWASENAKLLFTRLRPLHKLDQNSCLYLQAAAVLRNSGKAVSFAGHPEHSYYIVKNANFPFVESWESELVAQLCRHHGHAKIESKAIPFAREKSRRNTFLKLLGILSLLDTLDRDPTNPPQIKRVVVKKHAVHVTFTKGSPSNLEFFRAESRKQLFQQIFDRELVLARN